MSENAKRMLTLLMAAAMLLSMMPVGAAAQEQTAPVVEELDPVTDLVPETQLNASGATAEEAVALEQGVTQNVGPMTTQTQLWFAFTPAQSGRYYFTSISNDNPHVGLYVDLYADLYDAQLNQLQSDDDSGENWNFKISYALTANVTYYLAVRCWHDLDSSYQVLVEQDPLVSITLTPVSVVEQTTGWSMDDWGDEEADESRWYYYEYDVVAQSTYTATFSDGTVLTGSGTSFTYDGHTYEFSCYSSQSYEDPWQVGQTYSVEVSISGQEIQVPVTIIESPLESITFAPIEVVENTCGYESWGWDYDLGTSVRYFYYDEPELLEKTTFTATFSDGTVITGTGDSPLTYNGQEYWIYATSVQEADSAWTIGNTYDMTVSVLGQVVMVPVTITPLRAETFTFSEVLVPENTLGEDLTAWGTPYYHYSNSQIFQKSTYTLTFKDGTVLSGTGEDGFTYNDVWYEFSYTSEQSEENPWVAGNTYYITVTADSLTAQIPVTIVPSPIESITFEPVTRIKNVDGTLRQDWISSGTYTEEYYYYPIDWFMYSTPYTVTFTDGTVITGTGAELVYNGESYYFNYKATQDYNNQWTPGNTYYVQAEIMGQTVEVPVTITECPQIELGVQQNAVISTGGETVLFSFIPEEDGVYNFTSISDRDTYGYLYDAGKRQLASDDDSGKDSNFLISYTLSAGETYYIEVRYYSSSAIGSIPVVVKPTPQLQSLVFTPVSVVENTNGEMASDYNEETGSWDLEYYQYNAWDLLNKSTCTATFTDGTVYTGSGNGLVHDEVSYRMEYTADQSYANRWVVGNTYYITVSVLGMTAQIPVTVEPSPIQSITIEPITAIEGTCGYIANGWDEETQSWQDYYYYEPWNLLGRTRCTVTFADGTVEETSGNSSVYYNGEWYSLDINWMQGYDNQWTVGNTYYINAGMLGKRVDVPVTIVPSPVVSFVAEPVSIIEGKNCSEHTYWPGDGTMQKYYTYNWGDRLTYTITMNDGTVIKEARSGFWYQDQWYSISTADDQGLENQWTAGNTYTGTASVMGFSTEVSVTIKEIPIRSITFDPIVLEENKNGYWSWYNDDRYFLYDWRDTFRYTVTFEDGTVKSGSYWQSVEYQGEYYSINSYEDSQSYETPWLEGNTYTAQIKFEGKWYDVYVTVSRKTEDNGYTYFVQNGNAIINGCTLQTEILQIPETIDGYPVVGIFSLGEGLRYAKEIRVPDCVTVLSEDFLKRDTYESYTLPLKKLTIGSGVSQITVDMLAYAKNLERIDVAAENPYLCSIDGVVYDKAITTMVAYPPAKLDLHKMPDTVTDASILFELGMMYGDLYANVNVQFGAGISDYKMVDGVIYNPEMTTVIKATAGATGSYVMPDTVEEILEYAFAGSNLTSVTVSPSVTYIAYASFADAINLEEITIPPTVTSIGSGAFSNCDNLKKVHISDLTAWSEIWFFDNPLWYAHDLYLNGELVKDLVFPETVAEGVYGGSKINFEAFRGGSFETVTIPSRIVEIGHDAFADCENLKEVHITDLGAWSGTLFGSPEANPLYYAHDLYLNGELVKDLVLTETVADRVYGYRDVEWGYATELVYGVNKYAFYNASIETVTVPEMITAIKDEAFEGCEDLTRVNISDLSAWCGIEFETPSSNPLYYAQDLYLNGEKIVNLVLPETEINDRYAAWVVYGVGDYTFYNINIESLTVPEYVYKIGEMAFYGSSLQTVTFEDGCLDSIGYSAFESSGVTALALPDSLDTINPRAFCDCEDLQTVTFGEEVHQITYEAFRNTGIKSVALPDSLTYLGSEVFADCQNLRYVNFGKTLNGISYRCFYNTGLEKVTLPKQIEFIDGGAFEGSALTEVVFDCDNVTIYDNAFRDCPIGDLELGSNVTVEGWDVFAGINATQIKLQEGVTAITYREFAFNLNLVSVTIPETVETIYENAFAGDNNLSHVLYTGSLEQWHAMNNNSNELLRATLHCQANGDEVTTSQTCTTVTLYCAICDKEETVRKGNVNHTFNDNQICTTCGYQGFWEYDVDVKAGTVTITAYTGTDVDVVVPETIEGMPVTAITREVFAYNRKLMSVVLPEGITEIPAEAFSYCTALESVSAGDGVTAVGERAFYACEDLFRLYVPDTLQTIGDYAFEGSSLAYFEMPKSVRYIGVSAFKFCDFSSIEIPSGVTEIAYSAFANCWNLQEVTIPDTVTTIGYYAFSGARIQELTIPASVQEIGFGAFWQNGITTLTFLGNMPAIEYVFDETGMTVFYPAGDSTWESIPQDENQWIACKAPVITEQPTTAVVESGETATVAVEAYGQRLSYQWYYAAPGAKKFAPVGGDSVELSMEITRENSGGRAYCIVTDILGQATRTETVFLKLPANANGIRLSRLPYTLEYDMRQELRIRGLEVTMTYDDNTEIPVVDYTISGYDPNVSGEQTITVTFGNYTATFTVTVNGEKLNFANTEENVEISAPEGAVDSDAVLVVEKVYDEIELPDVPEILQENNAVVFDITLEKDGDAVQPEDTVHVSIPVPQHMESKRCKVYHIDDNGNVTDMNATYHDGRMVFATNHFSYYAVVEVTGVTVSGTVDGSGNLTGTLVKLLSGGEVLETVTTSNNGTYQFKNVVANDYVIEAVQEGLPSKQVDVSVTDSDVLLDILLAILGDVDGDDTVTRNDAIRVLLYVLNPTRFPLDAEADFDGDTAITRNDAIRVLLYVLNPSRFPLEN